MSTATYNLYSVVLAAATLLATGLGLVGVLVQVRKLRESAWATTHGKLSDQTIELLRFLSESPDAYPYLYDNRPLAPGAPERVRVLCLAEALANFLEHLVLQQTQLPAAQWAVWERFLRQKLAASQVVCRFITERAGLYSPALVAVARACERAAGEAGE